MNESVIRHRLVIALLRVLALIGTSPAFHAVVLEDGRKNEVAAVFTAPRTRQTSIAEKLGCAFEDGPTGPFIEADSWG